jgi:protein TonB
MKSNLNILVLSIIMIAVQACGPDSKKDESVAVVESESKAVVLTVAEKKAKLDKERAERVEARKIEIAKLAKVSPTYVDAKGNTVFIISEVMPSFNGGEDAMMDYLNDNVKFPKDAQDKGIEGTVFVDFVIAANGIVRDVEVTDATSEDVHQSFRNESIRVVSSMPAWVPGRQHGKAVDVKFSIPITFQIR